METSTIIVPVGVRVQDKTGPCGDGSFTLHNALGCKAEDFASIVLDYGRCEGGMPFFDVGEAQGEGPITVKVIYSETMNGIGQDNGDGPFFLFSNAMDSYRNTSIVVQPSQEPTSISPFYPQRSQRYQKLTLTSNNATIRFTKVGFRMVRPNRIPRARFACSDEQLNDIWNDGVRTVDMCSVSAGETKPAWETTSKGTRVRGQHWAPCRLGTRWTDKIVSFRVLIEHGGASWGVHMVVNGLIFCLDVQTRTLQAFEGLANETTIFPAHPRGKWQLPTDLDMEGWISVRVEASGSNIDVDINKTRIARTADLSIRPILGGTVNSGSVAFGGPAGWSAVYCDLSVLSAEGTVLYENDLSAANEARTFADFQVGTNAVACTIDGAKRDRACFGGDLFVSGRSIAYGGMDMEAVAGSIELLTSHQTCDGYLGNLCPIQAPLHNTGEPPTYSFYSLTYALQLVVAIKDHWLHSGNSQLITKVLPSLRKLQDFAKAHVNANGLLEASPDLSMTWFPMGGPIFGVSTTMNLAYFDSLRAMSILSNDPTEKEYFEDLATSLKAQILLKFWNEETGVLRMSTASPSEGLCQDAIAYAASLGVTPVHAKLESHLCCNAQDLPLAFRELGHWSKSRVISPYATGYALEALFAQNHGQSALDLMRRVWGIMADRNNPNFSGCHWEAMDDKGEPHSHDTSLVHAWSTWPVFLLPRYLAGLRSLAPGWRTVEIAPIRIDIQHAEYEVETPQGGIQIVLEWSSSEPNCGLLELSIPQGVSASVVAPPGYVLDCVGRIIGPASKAIVRFQKRV